MITSPLDQMYVDALLFAMFGLLTERNLTLTQMLRHNGYIGSTRQAYLMMVLNAVALCLSIAVPVVLYVHFGSFGNAADLINQMVGFFKYATWALIGFHLLFIPYFGYMAFWLWKKRDWRLADMLNEQKPRQTVI